MQRMILQSLNRICQSQQLLFTHKAQSEESKHHETPQRESRRPCASFFRSHLCTLTEIYRPCAVAVGRTFRELTNASDPSIPAPCSDLLQRSITIPHHSPHYAHATSHPNSTTDSYQQPSQVLRRTGLGATPTQSPQSSTLLLRSSDVFVSTSE